jgi:hypothetical protein
VEVRPQVGTRRRHVAWQTHALSSSAWGVVDPALAARDIDQTCPAQRLIRVTDAVVASTPAFRFARPFSGLEVVERAGEVIAGDGRHAGARALRQLRAG